MQINTTAPPPTIQPLPAPPPPPPKRAAIPKLDPGAQVSADAAAVGMTTLAPADQSGEPQGATPASPSNDDQATPPHG
jgi:hypothetical protein